MNNVFEGVITLKGGRYYNEVIFAEDIMSAVDVFKARITNKYPNLESSDVKKLTLSEGIIWGVRRNTT